MFTQYLTFTCTLIFYQRFTFFFHSLFLRQIVKLLNMYFHKYVKLIPAVIMIIYFISSGSRGAEGAMAPPSPVKIGHKKDGHQRRPHRFHVSRPSLTRPLDPLLFISQMSSVIRFCQLTQGLHNYIKVSKLVYY